MTGERLLPHAEKWWRSEIPLLLAMGYLQLVTSVEGTGTTGSFAALALLVVASIGIAGFGHMVNDAFDVGQDRLSAAANAVADRPLLAVALKLAALTTIGVVPWLVLPTPPLVWGLLAAELVLFLGYSAPPIRLKGRGLAGALADASYAYAIPLTVALVVIGEVTAAGTSVPRAAVVASWAFLLGLRHVLTHQLEVVARDRLTGVGTFMARRSWPAGLEVLVRRALPLEVLAFAAFLGIAGSEAPAVPIGFVLYAAYQAWRSRSSTVSRAGGLRPTPMIDRLLALGIPVLSRFHTDWLPLLLLGTLVVMHLRFAPLLVAHLLLFGRPRLT